MLVVVAIGLVVLAVSIAGARRPAIPRAERRVFVFINGWPDWLYQPLWLPMQLGNLVVGTAAGVAVMLVYRDWWGVVAVVAAMLLKLVTERFLRHRMAPYLAVRRRPGTSQPGAVLRGDVPVDGPSFPSGHAVLAAAVACVVADVADPVVAGIAIALAVLVGVGRIYVGAHNPLDITAGFGAGLIIGGLLGAI